MSAPYVIYNRNGREIAGSEILDHLAIASADREGGYILNSAGERVHPAPDRDASA
ncbi:hypothetical protein [Microbacterium phage MO526]|uniref:HNH endonuclease n=1 Tax=Microbacterium phage MO526 TaxID=3108092 RepID=A0ABZ1A1K9_9CAUD|nr:hypothetical protein [Microbacterium phage MO526]